MPSTISAEDLLGLMAYDGDDLGGYPFAVNAQNIQAFEGAETPDGGWVMLWRHYEPGIEGFLQIVH